MPEVIPCPGCDKNIKVPDGLEGKKLRCPGCQSILLVTANGLKLAKKEAVTAPSGKSSKPAPKKSAPRDEDEDDRDDRDEDDEDDAPRRKPGKRGRSGRGIPMWVWFAGGGGLAAVLLIVVLIIVLSGGGNKFDKIKEGMTEKEVTDILGKPTVSIFGTAVYYDPPLDEKDLMNLEKASKVKAVMTIQYENGKVKTKEVLKGGEISAGGKKGGKSPF